MIDKEKVLSLARLARLSISDEEADSLSREFSSILAYVGEVKEAFERTKIKKLDRPIQKNILRDDTGHHGSGVYTSEILNQAPARENNFIKVKKIL